MKVIKSIKEIDNYNLSKKQICITIGVFDGLHIGHRKLIKTTVEYAQKNQIKSVVLTFSNHPLNSLAPAYCPQSLLTNKKKVTLLKELGIDYLIMMPFDKQLSNYSPEKFIKAFLLKYFKIDCIVAGYDFKFGKDATGDIHLLQQLGDKYDFEIKVIKPVYLCGRIVSSTEIRELLLNGKILLANRMLARKYSIVGKVVKGDNRGKILGFPTANIKLIGNSLLPKNGVYLTKINFNGKDFFGMLNIGIKPTFDNQSLSVEIHIFDFDDHIYGKQLEISFLRRLRNEKKFGSSEQLKEQLIKDKKRSLQIIKTNCREQSRPVSTNINSKV